MIVPTTIDKVNAHLRFSPIQDVLASVRAELTAMSVALHSIEVICENQAALYTRMRMIQTLHGVNAILDRLNESSADWERKL